MLCRRPQRFCRVTFTLLAGTFNGDITGLMWDPIAGDGEATASRQAPAAVATIESGGRKGDNSITIEIKEATDTDGAADEDTARSSAEVTHSTTPGDPCAAGTAQTISFSMPRLANVGALAGANPRDPRKGIWLNANSRVVSGAFTNGNLTGGAPHYVVGVIYARDSVTLGISDANEMTIAISDDAAKGLMAFKSVKEKNKDGYVKLATVTVTTQQPDPATAVMGRDRTLVGKLRADGATTDADSDLEIYLPGATAKAADPYMLYDVDGEMIDEGLRGTLSVNAMGTRDLFNEDDMLFIDYDGNGKMGAGEAIAIDGDMGMGDALSIDPDKSESFDGSTGMFDVYYMPGGKGNINHEAMINLTAMVDYSDPSAIDEAPAKTSTTLKFDGVGNPVMAYAIPHSTNGTGDKGNVRVRCEASAGCRVFLECWDDMGMRGFGEAPMIAGNNVMVWSGEAIEGVTGMEPTSRHSCRVLSKGMVTVQQLTRDGNSGTLVNNTYVGGGM